MINNESKVQRNSIYDLLRFIGIVCIVIAHMGVPPALFQIRNFDVPFLVILSGIAYAEFSTLHYGSYIRYVKKRFYRLVVPTWIFLSLYYMSFYNIEQLNIKEIIFSFSLLRHEDIGVWIIRIFFSMALLAPVLYWLNSKLYSNRIFYLFIAFTFLFYVLIIVSAQMYLYGNVLTIFNVLFMYTIAYGLLYLYGIRINTFSRETIKKHFFVIAVVFLFYVVFYWLRDHTVYPTQNFKYPPEGYYLSYALMVSIALFYFAKFTHLFDKLSKNTFIAFIGSSTFWIYLWHWYILKLYNLYGIDLGYVLKFALIFISTVCIVYMQNQFLTYILTKMNLSEKIKKTLSTIFRG
ncbi:acyltransferase family protein [Sulfurovum sp. zt1-1]|uniref:Acyltransferase family protein n=1 Tax=Sulfurovum zhangzhouensis TaxID=3019067 RepID=A0ABT7R166_9BACT|nr:acyltransferase family protein [Sulfurovum zhangzhouensis]MDM5272544.1 acyltransferase family protein [Sulfurovum zhangzhouensis]